MQKMRKTLVVGVTLAMVTGLAACGGDDDSADAETPTEEATDTTEAEAVPTTTEAPAAFDLEGAVADYVAALPEGFLAVGDIDVFKEGAEASGALLVDVREIAEYEEGHIEGAINIPLRTLAQNLDKIPTDRQVYVYCASGFRAGQALASLGMLGYDNVLSFKPGWKGWTEAEEPVSTDAVEAEVVGAPEIEPALLEAVDGYLSTIPEGFLSAGDAEAVLEAAGAGTFLVDVRTAGEYADGHLDGAPNVDLRALVDGLGEIPTDSNVIAYCGSGHRAAIATAALHILGVTNVKGYGSSYQSLVDAGAMVAA